MTPRFMKVTAAAMIGLALFNIFSASMGLALLEPKTEQLTALMNTKPFGHLVFSIMGLVIAVFTYRQIRQRA